jgi:hypothetical protein
MQETPVLPNNHPKNNRRAALWIIAIIAVIFFVIIPGCSWIFDTSFGARTTYAPPGDDNSRFDPIAAADEVQAQVGEGAELIAMSATFVKSDGTQDLVTEVYFATTDYEFVREVPPPADAPPIGAGGSVDGRWYQVTNVDIFSPGQMRRVTGSDNYSYVHKGMDLDTDNPIGSKPATIPMPRCSFATLWEQALQDNIPAEAVARITYDESGYEFSISDLDYYAQFDMDCRYTGES